MTTTRPRASLSGGFTFGKTELDFGAAWTDSQGFPTRTTDDVDRGFHNLNTTAQLRTGVGAADVSLSYWRADGTTEYSDFFLAPVDQDFANSTTTIAVDFPLGAALRGSVTASHFDDKIEQNQTPDYLTTNRNSVGAQFDYDLSAVQSLSAGGMAIREKADSLSYGESMKADTSYANLFVQDRISSGPHRALLAVGYTNHETAGDHVTWNGEYGYTLHEGDPALRTCRNGLPRAGRDRPLRLRRQPRPGPRALVQHRGRRPAPLRRRARAVALGLPQRDRRPDRVRRAFI